MNLANKDKNIMKLFPGLAIITAMVFTTCAQADQVNYQNTTGKIETRIGTLEYKGGYPVSTVRAAGVLL